MLNKEVLLEVNNLITDFKTEDEYIRAVNDVSFTLHKGETIGIVGESGSGKSVTALSIMQLIPNPPGRVSGGQIIFHTKDHRKIDLTKISAKEMRSLRGNDIGMIFQEPMTSLNPVIKCGEQVMEAIMLHQKVNKRAARLRTLELFSQVQLPTPELMLDRYPHQLSGGQKQRVMIAMALACEPKLLVADEPTTALDVTIQKQIMDLLRELKEKLGMTILLITHNFGLVSGFANKVFVMFRGKIVESGPTSEILKHPRHPYTQALLACVPVLGRKQDRLRTINYAEIEKAQEVMYHD